MSNRQVCIAIDAIGGENSPYKILKGTEIFHKTNITERIFILSSKFIKIRYQESNYET